MRISIKREKSWFDFIKRFFLCNDCETAVDHAKKCFLLILATTSWFHVFSLLIDKKSQCNHVQWIRNEMFLYEFANNVQWEEREQISMFFTHYKDSIVKMWHNNLIFFISSFFYFFEKGKSISKNDRSRQWKWIFYCVVHLVNEPTESSSFSPERKFVSLLQNFSLPQKLI